LHLVGILFPHIYLTDFTQQFKKKTSGSEDWEAVVV